MLDDNFLFIRFVNMLCFKYMYNMFDWVGFFIFDEEMGDFVSVDYIFKLL